MKISKLKRWEKITIDGEDNLIIIKNNLSALMLDKSITKRRMLVKNFNFCEVRDGLINELRTLYYVVNYIFKREVKSDES